MGGRKYRRPSSTYKQCESKRQLAGHERPETPYLILLLRIHQGDAKFLGIVAQVESESMLCLPLPASLQSSEMGA
jgi:hypothetical protein